jgi:hypothetical protein
MQENKVAILTKDILETIMVGATHVIDMGGKTAFIYYENAERAHMLLPDGTRFDGRWELLDAGYRVEWTNGPTGVWSLAYGPGTIDYVDASGAARGRITRIDFSDCAKLAA